jgi:hypothetical protein
MSTAVEIIEINIDDKWEIVSNYYDLKHENCTPSGEYSDNMAVYKCNDIELGVKNSFCIDDYDYQEFLIESSYIESLNGFPEDVSEEAKNEYNRFANSPSSPGYFTLSQLAKAYEMCVNDCIKNIINEFKEENDNALSTKIDWIIKKLNNPETKLLKNKKTNGSFAEVVLKNHIADITMLRSHYERLRTFVDLNTSSYVKNCNVRIIWFIV